MLLTYVHIFTQSHVKPYIRKHTDKGNLMRLKHPEPDFVFWEIISTMYIDLELLWPSYRKCTNVNHMTIQQQVWGVLWVYYKAFTGYKYRYFALEM